MRRTYLWSIPIALAWPLTQNVIYVARFGHLSADFFGSSMIFVPMGLISALVLVYLLDRAHTINQRVCTIFGYLLASPFAYLGSLLSGLLLAPVVGSLVYGAAALVIGASIGYVVGGLLQSRDMV